MKGFPPVHFLRESNVVTPIPATRSMPKTKILGSIVAGVPIGAVVALTVTGIVVREGTTVVGTGVGTFVGEVVDTAVGAVTEAFVCPTIVLGGIPIGIVFCGVARVGRGVGLIVSGGIVVACTGVVCGGNGVTVPAGAATGAGLPMVIPNGNTPLAITWNAMNPIKRPMG